MNVIDVPSIVSLILGCLMAVLAGRGFARKVHDARVYGKGILGLPTYFILMMSYAFSVVAFVFPKLFTLPIQLVVGGFNVVSVVEGLVLTTSLTLVSYVFFLRRYRRVMKPLTLEGKATHKIQRGVMNIEEMPVKAYVALDGRVRGAVSDIKRKAHEIIKDRNTDNED